jgi:hypothetical protein
MTTALFWLAAAVAVGALIGQLMGFARAERGSRHRLTRAMLFVVWCGLMLLLFILFFAFSYCEANCASRSMNPGAFLIFVVSVTVNGAVLWLGRKGAATLP